MKIERIFSTGKGFENKDDIILRDYLALERTKLANERTLLAYIRSALYLLIGGIALIQLENFESIQILGYISLGLTVCFMIIGVYRYRKLLKRLNVYYHDMDKLKG